MTNKKIIVVLGMHRSGTSTITRALEVLGVSLGNRLMPAIEGNNDKGFFEDIDINALNVEMLECIDSDWHCLSPLELKDVNHLNENGYFIRAVDLLRLKTANSPLFGFKDPRVAKLLPFWHPVFMHCGFDVAYILALRNPLSIAQSIAKRDGFSHEKTYLLWLGHTLSSLFHTQQYNRVLVDYDHFIENSKDDIEMIAGQLGLKVNAKALHTFQSEFIDTELRHTYYTASDLELDAACPPLAKDVYTELLNYAQNNKKINLKDFYVRTEHWANEFGRLKSNLRLADKLSTQIKLLNRTVQNNNEKVIDFIKDLLKQDSNIFQKQFDTKWYVKKYPDIDNPAIDPYQHYILYGALEGRMPSDDLISFVRNAISDYVEEINIQFNQVKLSNDLQQLELTAHEQAHATQLQEVKQQHALQIETQNQEFVIREQSQAAQLAEIRLEIEAQVIDLVAREQAHTAQLQDVQQQHALQIDQYAQLKQLHRIEQTELRLQIEAQVLDLITREQTHATQLQDVQQQYALQIDQYAQLKQLHRSEQTELRLQIEAQVLESVAFKKMYAGLYQQLNALISTRSWRYTEPLRNLASIIKKNIVIKKITSQPSVATQNENNWTSDMNLSITGKSAASLEEIFSYNDETFINCAYFTLLGRSPDSDGFIHYLTKLRSGVSKIEILSQLNSSKEGKSKPISILGLKQSIVKHRLSRMPLLGILIKSSGEDYSKVTLQKSVRAIENKLYLLEHNNKSNVAAIYEDFSRIEKAVQNQENRIIQTQPTISKALQLNLPASEVSAEVLDIHQTEDISRTTHLLDVSNTVAPFSTEENTIKASIIILTKNPGHIFKEVLQAAFNQITPWKFEVIVVDSGSSDGTVEFIKRFPQAVLLEIPPNEFGHGKTRNFAISKAKGQYAAMLTHDAKPFDSNWLFNLVKPLDDDTNVAGVFGRHKAYPDHSIYTKRDMEMHFNSFLQWPAVMGMEDPERYWREEGYRQVLHFFSDNNACLRKEIWEKIPYPDVNFAEDQLWAKAIIEAGYKRAYADDAVVYHSHDYSIKDTFRRSFDESRALKSLFGYDLCPSAKHGIKQTYACAKSDLKYLVATTGFIRSAGLAIKTPVLHTAKQAGWFIGRYQGKRKDMLFRLFSLDNAKKRKSNLTFSDKVKQFFNKKEYPSNNQPIANIETLVQKTPEQPIANNKTDVIGFYNFVITKDAGMLPITSNGEENTINWLIPDFGIGSGGHLNIFRFINMLEQRGYKNTICIIGAHQHSSTFQAREMIAEHFFRLEADVVFGTENLDSAHFSFATSWITAYALKGFGAAKHKLYFVQDFEPAFYSHGSEYDFAEETYKFGFTGICAGSWLSEKLYTDYGMKCHSVGFSYDRDLYIQTPRRDAAKQRVFCYCRPPTIRRGWESAMLALSLVGDAIPEVEFIFAGWDMSNYHFPYPHLNAGICSLKELPDLYSQCDAALVFSFTNLSLLPLELMACGCVVVSNKAANTEWLLNDGNSVLPESSSPRSIADAIIKVLTDTEYKSNLISNAKIFANSTNWEAEGDKFSEILDAMYKISTNPAKKTNSCDLSKVILAEAYVSKKARKTTKTKQSVKAKNDQHISKLRLK